MKTKQKALHYKMKTKKRKKNKVEFSKKWLIACIVISLFYTSLSYILGWFEKNTLETLSIEILQLLWGSSSVAFMGYIIQNSVRAYTSSKFGIPTQDNNTSEGGDNSDN